MKTSPLRLAAELDGALLSGPGGSLVLVERVRAHGLPTLLVLGREREHLDDALAAWASCDAAINLIAILPSPDADLGESLRSHRRRIGALTAALDVSLPWLDQKPMLAKRLPGRAVSNNETPVEAAPVGPIERSELRAFLEDWDEARIETVFSRLPWRARGTRFEIDLWPDASLPPGATLEIAPIRLAAGSALMDALRIALRHGLNQAIPLLPLPSDPSGLHALRGLTPHVAAFRGPVEVWRLAFKSLSTLPAPPHFCARC